ncbi:MAG: glycosyltransferase family 2 protein [Bacteroidota bacterium]
MQPLSVVICCKNEASIIGNTLQSLQGLTDDIIIYDNGSTDGTQEAVKQYPVQLHEGNWEGFGKTKNKAIALAKYDWILSLDADEAIDEALRQSLLRWQPEDEATVYEMAFKNFFKAKPLKFGEWGADYHARLFNRKQVKWDEAPVHESLVLPPGTAVIRVKGYILHRTLQNVDDYKRKMQHYAQLGAQKYYEEGKKAAWLRRKFSPAFSFFSSYILKRGFLDGREGFLSARITAWYTAMKYARLRELNRQLTIDNKQKTP